MFDLATPSYRPATFERVAGVPQSRLHTNRLRGVWPVNSARDGLSGREGLRLLFATELHRLIGVPDRTAWEAAAVILPRAQYLLDHIPCVIEAGVPQIRLVDAITHVDFVDLALKKNKDGSIGAQVINDETWSALLADIWIFFPLDRWLLEKLNLLSRLMHERDGGGKA